MENQNRDIRHTIEDILMFSLYKIYSGCVFSNSKDDDCLKNFNSFKRYFEYLSKEAAKYISKHYPIGCSLIPFILAKDLELYFNGWDYDFNENLKYELIKIIYETYYNVPGLLLYMSPIVTESQGNGDVFTEKRELFKCSIILTKELFRINLLYFDSYKLYEAFVRKTKIKSFDEFSSSDSSILLFNKFLNLLNLSILPRTEFYRVLLACLGGLVKSPRFSVKLSLVLLTYTLKICKKLLREYKENVIKINKDLRLIYGILVFSVFSRYMGIIFQCLYDMVCLSETYKIRDEKMEKIIKIFTAILNDCYSTMFIEENKIWPEIKNCKYIYREFCKMWEFPISELQGFYRGCLSEKNKYDKSKSLWYSLKDIAGISGIMERALSTIG